MGLQPYILQYVSYITQHVANNTFTGLNMIYQSYNKEYKANNGSR